MVTSNLQKQGFIVLRFWEHDINNNLDFCISQIINILKKDSEKAVK
jgi:very-short-patch-repair endonuclease